MYIFQHLDTSQQEIRPELLVMQVITRPSFNNKRSTQHHRLSDLTMGGGASSQAEAVPPIARRVEGGGGGGGEQQTKIRFSWFSTWRFHDDDCDDDDDVDLIRCQAFAPSTLAVWFIGFPSTSPLSTCTRSISEAQAHVKRKPKFWVQGWWWIFINIWVTIWRRTVTLNIFSNFSTLLDCRAIWVSEALPKSRFEKRVEVVEVLGDVSCDGFRRLLRYPKFYNEASRIIAAE